MPAVPQSNDLAKSARPVRQGNAAGIDGSSVQGHRTNLSEMSYKTLGGKSIMTTSKKPKQPEPTGERFLAAYRETKSVRGNLPAALSDDEKYECLRAVYLHALEREEQV